jgi:putative addiction module component (TIGR02574 family)
MTLVESEQLVATLSVSERLDLLDQVWISLRDDGAAVTPQWHLDEIQRRITAADANPSASIPLDEFRRQMKGSGK